MENKGQKKTKNTNVATGRERKEKKNRGGYVIAGDKVGMLLGIVALWFIIISQG